MIICFHEVINLAQTILHYYVQRVGRVNDSKVLLSNVLVNCNVSLNFLVADEFNLYQKCVTTFTDIYTYK